MDKNRGIGNMRKLLRRPIGGKVSDDDMSGKSATACRLPPNLRTTSSVTPDSKHDDLAWNWSDPEARKLLALSVFLMIVISWVGLASLDHEFVQLNATSQVVAGQHITGTSGQETAASRYESVYDAFVLNEDPFVGSPQWYENGIAKYRFVNKTDEGVFLELWGDEVGTAFTKYWRVLNLPLEDYSNATFSTGIKVLSGQASCTIRIVFTQSPDAYSRDWDLEDYPFDLFSDQNTTLVTAGEEIGLSMYVLLDDLIDYYPGWLVQSWFYIDVTTNQPTTMIIKSAQVRVASEDLLCPLDIDIESANGSSLFDNDFVKWANTYPILNLTRDNGSEGYSVVRPSRRFDLMYVRPGRYSGVAGWWMRGDQSGELGTWQTGSMLCPVQVNASADPDEGLSMRVKIPAVRLFLEASPLPPLVSLEITESRGNMTISVFRMTILNTPLPVYVYIPGLNATLDVSIEDAFLWIQGTGLHLHAGFQMDGSEDIRFVAAISYSSVLGVTASPVAILRLVLEVLLFVLSVLLGCLYTGNLSMTRMLRNPLVLSIGCLFVSMLVPWYSGTDYYQSYGPPGVVSVSSFFYYITLQSNDGGSPILAAEHFYGLQWFGLLFWILLFVLGTRLMLAKKNSLDRLSLVLLVVPVLLPFGVEALWFSNIGPGVFLSAAAPVVYLVGEMLRLAVPRMRAGGILSGRRK